MEDVQRRFREGPVYYASKLKQERDVIPDREDGLTNCVILVNHKASLPQLWHPGLKLEGLQYEIKHEQSVKNNKS